MYRTLWVSALTVFLVGCPSEAPTSTTEAPDPAVTNVAPKEPPADTPKGPEALDGSQEAETALGTMAMGKDPVCKMDVDLNKAAAQHTWGDETFVFCSAHCAEAFKKDPKTYVEKKESR